MLDNSERRTSDEVVEALSEYALACDDSLSASVALEVSSRVLDVIGCALGGFHEPVSQSLRRYVYDYGGSGESLLWGTGFRTTAQKAALVNGSAARCLDFNDGYMGKRGDGGHPSDVIPGLLGVAEGLRRSGKDLIVAIAIAYEVMVSLTDAWSVKAQGFDHVSALAIAGCCGVGRLLQLTRSELAEALAIVTVSGVALTQTRKDQITMWKSVAAAHAMEHAIEACLLSKAGIRGASLPFEGSGGFLNVAGGDQGLDWGALESIVELRAPSKILDTNLKLWPIGQVAQSSVDVAVELHHRIEDFDDIDEIVIYTFAAAKEIMSGPENWHPVTRETADHSLPYGTVAALMDGGITASTFHEKRLKSSGIRELLASRVRLEVLDEYTNCYPEAQPAKIEVRLRTGARLVGETMYPQGHARNRASIDAYHRKFELQTDSILGAQLIDVREAVTDLASLATVRSLTDLLVL